MASISFTYGGNYDSTDTVVLSQNALDSFTDRSGTFAVGPIFDDRFVMNGTGDLADGGTYFVDSEHTTFNGMFYSNDLVRTISYSISADLSDNTGTVNLTGGDFGDVLRGGSGDDALVGGAGNDLLEGGLGTNTIDGGTGTNTVSYEHYVDADSNGVLIDLDAGSASSTSGVSVFSDTLTDIQNARGSIYADSLTGDASANTLSGNGGGDALFGMGGNDRLVVTDSPTEIDGGAGTDFLFVQGGGSVVLDSIVDIEKIYVRNDTSLDMSAVDAGAAIVSQSVSGHAVDIVGSAGADRIVAGKGGDTIDGGGGRDKLFAGAGDDTFHFTAGYGRDDIYRFDTAHDTLNVSALVENTSDIVLSEFGNGGADTLISFAGDSDSTHMIVLHNVSVASLSDGNFLFPV